ncbi:MAG: hypothetical protein JSU63_18645 [Phycisphaerales bacterium]|nr:MAG: hypothetical protein JSU63_18645 [Phycisphaerales bacterium]
MAQVVLETSLRDLVQAVFRRKWSIAVVVLVTMASALVYLELIREPKHIVSAKLLVKLGQEQAPPPTMLGETPMIVSQRFQEMNSEIEILVSNDLLAEVVDELGLDQPALPDPVPEKLFPRIRYEVKNRVREVKAWVRETLITLGLRERLSPREHAIATLRRRLAVTSDNDSNVIVVHLLAVQRRGSGEVLNYILDKYLQSRQRIYQDSGTVAFFEEQARTSLARLKEVESRLEAFETASDIRLLEHQKAVLLDQIADAESSLAQARLELQLADSKVTRLEDVLNSDALEFSILGEFERSSFPDSLLDELVTLRRQREKLRLTELDDGLLIRNNDAQFQVILATLASHLQSVLREKQEIHDTRAATLAEHREALAGLHADEMEWRAMRREAKLLEDRYLFNQKKRDEASTITAMELSKLGNVVVIERAMDPLEQAGTRKLTLLGISFVVAFLAAFSWVAVVEFFDHRVYNAEQLEEHLGAPVAAVIPIERRAAMMWRR